jgi:hypothetical protein
VVTPTILKQIELVLSVLHSIRYILQINEMKLMHKVLLRPSSHILHVFSSQPKGWRSKTHYLLLDFHFTAPGYSYHIHSITETFRLVCYATCTHLLISHKKSIYKNLRHNQMAHLAIEPPAKCQECTSICTIASNMSVYHQVLWYAYQSCRHSGYFCISTKTIQLKGTDIE